MAFLLKGGNVFLNGGFSSLSIAVDQGKIIFIGKDFPNSCDCLDIIDVKNKYVFPGFTCVHVHGREPGFSYKETIKTMTKAAAHGGYTSVFTMPNLNPCPDSLENLKIETDIIKKDALIKVYPYGSITKGERGEELSDINSLADKVAAFSDDGKGVENDDIMYRVMLLAKSHSKIIAAHCEYASLVSGGYINDCEYAKKNNRKGISSESEWKMIKRDLALLKKTGCSYHVCHVSAKESVELIREAKKRGLDVTCETAPHYLTLNDGMLKDDGSFKMNPPLRSEEDRLSLIEGIKDGTIDMIATDHAPHSKEEKSGGLKNSLMGIVGLETSFPVLYTELVLKNIITLPKLIELLSLNPAKRFLNKDSSLKVGVQADIAVFDLDTEYKIDPENFFSKGKSTPFTDKTVKGECIMTFVNGELKYKK